MAQMKSRVLQQGWNSIGPNGNRTIGRGGRTLGATGAATRLGRQNAFDGEEGGTRRAGEGSYRRSSEIAIHSIGGCRIRIRVDTPLAVMLQDEGPVSVRHSADYVHWIGGRW